MSINQNLSITLPGPVSINRNLGINPPGPVSINENLGITLPGPVSKNENLGITLPGPVSITPPGLLRIKENLSISPPRPNPPRTKNNITDDIFGRNFPPPPQDPMYYHIMYAFCGSTPCESHQQNIAVKTIINLQFSETKKNSS